MPTNNDELREKAVELLRLEEKFDTFHSKENWFDAREIFERFKELSDWFDGADCTVDVHMPWCRSYRAIKAERDTLLRARDTLEDYNAAVHQGLKDEKNDLLAEVRKWHNIASDVGRERDAVFYATMRADVSTRCGACASGESRPHPTPYPNEGYCHVISGIVILPGCPASSIWKFWDQIREAIDDAS